MLKWGWMIAAAATGAGGIAEADNARSVRIAVEYRDVDAVRAAVAAHRVLEERDEVGSTPLIIATGSGQFGIAEPGVAMAPAAFMPGSLRQRP